MFCQWAEDNPTHPFYKDILLRSGDYHELLHENRKGTLTYETFSAKSRAIDDAIIEIIKSCQAFIANQEEIPLVFRNYHSLAVNRSSQSIVFKDLFKSEKKLQFFSIYGEEYHFHKSMFERIAFEKEGKLNDRLGTLLYTNKKPKMVQVQPFSKGFGDLNDYKKGLLTSFFGAFNLKPNEYAPLLDKKFRQVLENSPRINNKDYEYVWVFLNIEENVWDPVIIPKLVRWFINDFCKNELPIDSPKFVFFFGIIYEEEDETVKKEVQQLLENSQLVETIPELNMVTKADIEEWFSLYQRFMPRKRMQKELMKTCMQNLAEYEKNGTYFMEDVQEELVSIIKECCRNRLSI